MTTMRSCFLALLLVLASNAVARAQELEPGRWNHLPINTSFLGIGYAYADGDLSFDPVLQIEDATVEIHTVALRTIRSFDLLGFSARVDLSGAYQDGTWKGTLAGAPARVDRKGWADPIVRFTLDLYGAPPLEGKAFAEYRAAHESHTIVGVGVSVQVPLGEYFDDKLINLGTNRFTIRPQLGVVYDRGSWKLELTGSTWIYTDNDDFYGGNELENKPFYTIQGHVRYNVLPMLWVAGGLAYGNGARSTVSGDRKDDRKENLVYGASVGYFLTRNLGLKVGYLGTSSLARTGTDFDSVIVAATLSWPDSWVRSALGLDK